MRLLAASSLGGEGHFNALLPLLAAAARRGDEPLVVGPPALGELIERAGYPFRAGAQPTEAELARSRMSLPSTLRSEAALLGTRESYGELATQAMLPAMDEAVAAFRPDLVLREPWEYSSAVIARARRITVAQVAISQAGTEHEALRTQAPMLERLAGGLAEEMRGEPYLTRFPASLDPSPFPHTARYHEVLTPDPRPLPDWWAGSEAPLLYVTFGSVLPEMSVARAVFRLAIESVADLDARVLLTVGRRFDPASAGSVPPNVHIEGWVDHADVFALAEAVLCHGGSGTVLGALAAGVPLVAVPLFADQFENARAVARSGAGVAVEGDRSGKADERRAVGGDGAPLVAAAVREVLGNDSYRHAAGRLASEMAATATPEEVLDGLLAGPRA